MSLSLGSSRIARGNKAPRCRIAWAEGFEGGQVPDDTETATTLGTLSGQDPDGDSVTFSIALDPDSKFTIDGTALKLNASLDAEADTSHSVKVRATDTHGAYTERTFTISVIAAEGGGEPEWLEAFRAPSGDLPLLASDFQAGNYWLNGAECAVTDILAGGLNQAAITASGMEISENNDNRPILTAAALAHFQNNKTALFEFVPIVGLNPHVLFTAYDNVDYNSANNAVDVRWLPTGTPAGRLTLEDWDVLDLRSVTGVQAGTNRFAANFAATVAHSLNGEAAVSEAYVFTDMPICYIGHRSVDEEASLGGGAMFRKIAAYAVQPSGDLDNMTAA